ncbi:Endoglucanase 3 [Striga hermonthica]|uniref:Endoglucanase n=1 Tax=Striga hermonthica TaxID=68872 RepID=A0A9N7MNU6_STRHE|nr:Endoglucanase 3 [Striga hermonthica]
MAAAIFFKAGSHFVLLSLILHLTFTVEGGSHNYHDALAKSILFFQGQRSGKLHNQDQALGWRGDSALSDGQSDGVDLTGGYYDAGDNVKFNFPMAFTITMLSWGVTENGKKMGQLPEAMAAIRWGTDYLLKSAQHLNTTGKLYAVVGDPNDDHRCWERAEDMDTERTAYYVTREKPGSDLAAEMAAAMASASMVFRKTDSKYSRLLLQTAKNVMQFAVDNRGAYSDFLAVACPFYCSYSGYIDDLIWGAAWLHRATNDNKYLDLIQSLGDSDPPDLFSWDNKFAGADVLLARRYLVSKDEKFVRYSERAEAYMCKIMPNSPSSTVPYTPGRLMYRLGSSNLQYVTSATLLLTTYAKYMAASGHTFECGSFHTVTPAYLRNLAKTQVDYILGDNPMKMSYMVGYGTNFPKKIHHRGSSMPQFDKHNPTHIGCDDGMEQYFHSSSDNPNILTGAIVGGPDSNDQYKDQREDATQSEPATYINAAIVGPLAYFARTKQY